ncbi:MAG: PEP-CTERM sorting domain-containing protein, partial [Acidobacteria bacterium]|nr:PEP-CTERM sorting domain-containing protein [Acidobacteriota bacterium]
LFTPSRRFDMVFGSNGTSSWAGLSMFTDAGNPALQVALTGTGYFNFEMRYDPGTQRASLFVNGNQALTGYAGHTQFLSNGVAFGVTGSTPQAYFQNVQFSINDPQTGVPEPGTLVLAGLGCVATGIRYQRGRKSA